MLQKKSHVLLSGLVAFTITLVVCISFIFLIYFTNVQKISDYLATKTVSEDTVLTPSITHTPIVPKKVGDVLTLRVKSGDSLYSICDRAGISSQDAMALIDGIKGQFSPTDLRPKQKLLITKIDNQLQQLIIHLSIEEELQVDRIGEEKFTAKLVKKPLDKKLHFAEGTIDSSLFLAAAASNIPDTIMMNMISALSYDVDFQRDIHSGDKYRILYERLYDEEGNKTSKGKILFAKLQLKRQEITLYHYKDTNGTEDFYSESGNTLRRALLKTPIHGARISSRYGMRKHPIKQYSRMHKGIDFAASRGTPIYAAGNGTITRLGNNGGYGKYIRIRHNGRYSTAYAHMARYGKGMRKGQKVKQGQIIGYVGSTGQSTGPHLHYEVLSYGKHVNPNKVKLQPGQKLGKAELARFKQHIRNINTIVASLPSSDIEIASTTQQHNPQP